MRAPHVKQAMLSWWVSAVELLSARQKPSSMCTPSLGHAAKQEPLPASTLPSVVKEPTGSAHAALLMVQVVREWLPSCDACLRINVDATSRGNAAHFFSHSCDGGNLAIVLVRRRGSLIPLLAMFARRDIRDGEELTFRYGVPPSASLIANEDASCRTRRPCFCGASQCVGLLPAAPV